MTDRWPATYGSRTIPSQPNTRSKKASRGTVLLTPAESRILSLVPTRLTPTGFGTELGIGRPTVQTDIENTDKKLGATSAPKRQSWLRPEGSCPPGTDGRLPIVRHSQAHTLALAGGRRPGIWSAGLGAPCRRPASFRHNTSCTHVQHDGSERRPAYPHRGAAAMSAGRSRLVELMRKLVGVGVDPLRYRHHVDRLHVCRDLVGQVHLVDDD